MADSIENTSAFTRALTEAKMRQQQQLQAHIFFTGTGKRDASFLEEDDDIFPSTIHLTPTGVSQLRPIAPYPARGYYDSTSAVFRHATPTGNDFFALPLPTVDLTKYPFTWTLPGVPTMPMPPTTKFRSRSPPTTPYVKRQRFDTPPLQPPFNSPRSPSPYPSPLSTPQPASLSPQAGSAESTSKRATRSGRSFAQPWRGATHPSASVPRTSESFGSSVQNQNTSTLPITLPALPAGLPTPTPGLPNVHQEPHACVLQCTTSFTGVFKPGFRPRGDRYKTHMFGSGTGLRKKNPPCSVAVQMGCTKDKSGNLNVDLEVVGTFLLHKEPGLAPNFEYAQICGDLREALVAWYAGLVAQAAEHGSVEQEGEADDGLTDRDAEYDEEFDGEDLMYK